MITKEQGRLYNKKLFDLPMKASYAIALIDVLGKVLNGKQLEKYDLEAMRIIRNHIHLHSHTEIIVENNIIKFLPYLKQKREDERLSQYH